jgi:hypothetical protein
MTLRRIQTEHAGALNESSRRDLERDISLIELKYFGPEGAEHANGDLSEVLTRWAHAVRR